MQRDFHYNAVKVLCRYAGFDEDSAQTIAYASQYVDDSVEHRKMYFDKSFDRDHDRYGQSDCSFDPICTAHKGINFVKGISSDAQIGVYIPFHFIPEEQYLCQRGYQYTAKKNGPLVRELLYWASQDYKKRADVRSLIKLGIALHSFADSWSHNLFSGRYSIAENSVEAIYVQKERGWEKESPLKLLFGSLFPDIGHAEAFLYPDSSHIVWKYRNRTDLVYRDNALEFMEAAEAIYKHLLRLTGAHSRWDTFALKLEKCFRNRNERLSAKCNKYIEEFPDLLFSYSASEWKDSAVEKIAFDWDNIGENEYPRVKYRKLDDERWFLFHEEAFEQRKYINHRIKLF